MCQFRSIRYQAQYHVACQIQKKILAKLGLQFQHPNRVPQASDADCDLSPKDLSSLISSWDRIEERKRILRMKGLPRAVDARPKEKKAAPATFSE